MHCHVPMHMMEGMVGSLLVINGGEAVTPLPVGRGCPLRVAEPAPPYQPQVRYGGSNHAHVILPPRS